MIPLKFCHSASKFELRDLTSGNRTGKKRLQIGEGYFILRGTVAITDTPDPGRECRADKNWRFAITQNRQYYRLREFEWCDGLTDYVDIYF